MIASKIVALMLAVATRGQISKEKFEAFQVWVDTGYTEEGLPSAVITKMFVGFGHIDYSRETSQGHTVIWQYDKVTGLEKIALEGGTEVLVTKHVPHTDKPSKDESLGKPDKTKVRRIAGCDCYAIRSAEGDIWVRTSNPKDPKALILYEHGKISESIVFLESRKSLASDVRLFGLPAKARVRRVTNKQFEAFRDKYVPDMTPNWIWSRP